MHLTHKKLRLYIKCTVKQTEKAPINGCLRVSKASREFCIPIIYNFAVIYT